MNGKGALAGAASGAAMGSVAGPWGAAAGGVIGGALGLFSGGDDNKYQATNPYDSSTLSTALSNNNQVYGQQQTLAQALLAQAQGQGPNPALLQLHQTTDQNAQAAAGLLASQRGLNPALAARMAAEAQTTANQTAGGQAAVLGAQQQLAAQGELGGLYGQMGSQQLQQQQLYNNAQANVDKLNSGVSEQNSKQNTATDNAMMGGMMNGAGAVLGHSLNSPSTTSTNQQIGGTNAGSLTPKTMMAAHGAIVPGQAQVAGDSKKNDTVKAMLSPGEIVIPRSHAQNAQAAKEFIDHLMKSKSKKASSEAGFGKVLEAHRNLQAALQTYHKKTVKV